MYAMLCVHAEAVTMMKVQVWGFVCRNPRSFSYDDCIRYKGQRQLTILHSTAA